MRIVFTKHALKKFGFHKQAGWSFSRTDIKETIQNPHYFEILRERSVESAIKKLDQKHDFRVIYRKEDDIIIIVTFYPTEKGRYVKNEKKKNLL